MQPAFQRKDPARRSVSGEILVSPAGDASRSGDASARSFVQELESSDSERVTEVPTSDDMFALPDLAADLLRADLGFETIPAPSLDEEVPAHED